MNNQIISNHYQQLTTAIKAPQRLKGKDVRCDPLASSIIHCIEGMLAQQAITFDQQTAVVVLTSTGCKSHVERVTSALEGQRPRQGFFSRGGPQMLANYSSIAFDLHGASISYICNDNNYKAALSGVSCLYKQGVFKQLILVRADYIDQHCYCVVHHISGQWDQALTTFVHSTFSDIEKKNTAQHIQHHSEA